MYVAAQQPQACLAPHAIADQQIEQVFGRLHSVSIELDQHVAHEHTGGRGRTPVRHADDEERDSWFSLDARSVPR